MKSGGGALNLNVGRSLAGLNQVKSSVSQDELAGKIVGPSRLVNNLGQINYEKQHGENDKQAMAGKNPS
jgi:hypothetical protein